jgi:hypothetical protein
MRVAEDCLFTVLYIRDRTDDPVIREKVLVLQVTCKLECDHLLELSA